MSFIYREEYHEKLENQTREAEDEKAARDEEIRKNAEALRQVEDDYEQEMQQLEDRARNAYMTQKQSAQQLQADNTLLKRKMQRIQEQQAEDQKKIEQKEEEKGKLRLQQQRLQQDISKLQSEVQARDLSLEERDGQINRLNHKVNELEKFRFVLQHRKDELAKEVEPQVRNRFGFDLSFKIGISNAMIVFDLHEMQKEALQEMKESLEQRDNTIRSHVDSAEDLRNVCSPLSHFPPQDGIAIVYSN